MEFWIKTRQLIVIAFAVVKHCESCIGAHVKEAIDMGITRTEIAEVASVAITMD